MSVLLNIVCPTYNHEKYLGTAIEGFLNQETNFEYDINIFDDCSPDNTSKIVHEYISQHPRGYRINYYRHEKNIGMWANGIFSLTKCNARYIAICEGDDYWTDPNKLQMQVEFLEANEDYGLVHTNTDILYTATGELERLNLPRQEGFIFESLLKANQISTLTIVARTALLKEAKASELLSSCSLVSDYPLWLYIATKSKIKFIDKVTSLYRHNIGSAYNTSDPVKGFLLREELTRMKMMFADAFHSMPIALPNLIQEHRNNLYFAGMNHLPVSASKAFFLKDNKKVRPKDFLLLILSKSKTGFRIKLFLKKLQRKLIVF